MLTRGDKLRLTLRSWEYCLGQFAQRATVGAGLVRSPYLPEDNTLKAIFIHVPKSAGTSLRLALYGRKSFHIPASRYYFSDPVKFAKYFSFSFVRNPYDRLSSAFHYLHAARHRGLEFFDYRWAATELGATDNFQDFVYRLGGEERYRCRVLNYIHFRRQLDWITNPEDRRKPIVDYIGKFEELDASYEIVSRQLGVYRDLPAERVRPGRRDFRAIYNSRMIDIVSDLYSDDLEVLGYQFEI